MKTGTHVNKIGKIVTESVYSLLVVALLTTLDLSKVAAEGVTAVLEGGAVPLAEDDDDDVVLLCCLTD